MLVSHAKLRNELGGIEVPEVTNGDNLIIALASVFEDGSEENGEDGWEPHALAKAYAVLDAIHAYYAPHLKG
jgi:hypothetical protein